MDASVITSAIERLQLSAKSGLALVDGAEFAARHYPPTPPDVSLLLIGIESQAVANQVKNVLLAAYPAEHELRLLRDESISSITVEELGGVGELPKSTSLFVPPAVERSSFESLAEIVAHLRAPNGCPWDREQTHLSLRTHLLEEAYETLAAIDAMDTNSMREEFGDLLLQVMLNAQIASEAGEFTVNQVIKSIGDKLIRRHPHVFGDTKVRGVDEVLENWERLKERERNEQQIEKSLLDGVPVAMPALGVAQEYQDRAARVGFDWPRIDGVLEKVQEEIREIESAEGSDQVGEEIGDLLFVLVNYARWKGVDAESALRATNLKFRKRFGLVEQHARERGTNLSELTLAQMDALWEEAKGRD